MTIYLKMRKLFLVWMLFLCVPTTVFSQSPAGVPQPKFWFQNTLDASAAYATSSRAGNYFIDATDRFFDALEQYQTESSDGTWFWVLLPKFSVATGTEFARFGDVVINDYGIQVGSSWYNHSYARHTPILLQAHYGGSTAHKVHQQLLTKKGDSSLFDVAEALFFDRVLTEFDRRRVESYLGLKYSLNVTINATGLWKDYLAAEGDSVWDSQTDTYYNQEVLGLGYDTLSNWYQVQTATNDSDKVIIAVDTVTYLGHQARSALAPGSKAVFSLRKKRQWGTQAPCESHSGYPVIWEGWKFRLNHWGAVNSQFEVLLDGGVVSSGVQHPMVVLSGEGSYVEYLPVRHVGGTLRFTIPLDSIGDNTNYYIAMVDSGAVCQSQVIFQTVDEISCGNAAGGAIAAFVAQELLPAQLTITTSGAQQVQTIATSRFEIDGLSKGTYDVHLANGNGLLALSHFELGKDCPCSAEAQWEITQAPSESRTMASSTITAHPNPAQAGKTVRFEVTSNEAPLRYLIYTRDGRLVTRQDTSNKQWNYTFPVPGTYTVECVLESSTVSAQIIIQ